MAEAAPLVRQGAGMPLTADDVAALEARFRDAEPGEVLRWAAATFAGRLAVLSSFGVTSGVLLSMLAELGLKVPVVFLQTGRHFSQTLDLRDTLATACGLTVEEWGPGPGAEWPPDLHLRPDLDGVPVPDAARAAGVRSGADLCCWLRKVEPLSRALATRDAFITSLRRDGGTELRLRTRVVELHRQPGRATPLVKVNPLAHWSRHRLWGFIHAHRVPVHGLWARGFASVGCAPCTRPVRAGEPERAGRWHGTAKSECGLHTAPADPDWTPRRIPSGSDD
jgi:phosphoadenosine phosphosulfate reductase